MRVHFLSPGRETVEPPGAAPERLGAELRQLGHEVSVGGDADEAEVLVGVEPRGWPSVRSAVRIAWLWSAEPPEGHWDVLVAQSRYHAALLRGAAPSAPVEVVEPGAAGAEDDAPDVRNRLVWPLPATFGLHHLLGAWPAIWRRTRMPLHVLGELRGQIARLGHLSDERGVRLRAVAELVNQPGVVVMRPLTDPERLALLRRCAAALLPIDEPAGTPLVAGQPLWELRACGVVPVAWPRGAAAEVLGDANVPLPEGRPGRELAEAWADTVDDAVNRCDELGPRAALGARTWADAAREWDAVLRRLSRPDRPMRRRPGFTWRLGVAGAPPADRSSVRALLESADAAGHVVHVHTGEPWSAFPDARYDPGLEELERAIRSDGRPTVLWGARASAGLLERLLDLPVAPPVAVVEGDSPEEALAAADIGPASRVCLFQPASAWHAYLVRLPPGRVGSRGVARVLPLGGAEADGAPALSATDALLLEIEALDDVARPRAWRPPTLRP